MNSPFNLGKSEHILWILYRAVMNTGCRYRWNLDCRYRWNLEAVGWGECCLVSTYCMYIMHLVDNKKQLTYTQEPLWLAAHIVHSRLTLACTFMLFIRPCHAGMHIKLQISRSIIILHFLSCNMQWHTSLLAEACLVSHVAQWLSFATQVIQLVWDIVSDSEIVLLTDHVLIAR